MELGTGKTHTLAGRVLEYRGDGMVGMYSVRIDLISEAIVQKTNFLFHLLGQKSE